MENKGKEDGGMKAKWEVVLDETLIPAIDDVMNALYRESMINGRLNVGYMNHCTKLIKEKASNYVDGKLNALIGANSDIK